MNIDQDLEHAIPATAKITQPLVPLLRRLDPIRCTDLVLPFKFIAISASITITATITLTDVQMVIRRADHPHLTVHLYLTALRLHYQCLNTIQNILIGLFRLCLSRLRTILIHILHRFPQDFAIQIFIQHTVPRTSTHCHLTTTLTTTITQGVIVHPILI